MTDPAPFWPRLMRRETAAAYCSLSVETFEEICPVNPLEIGARVTVWDRARLDAWLDGVPERATGARARRGQRLDKAAAGALNEARPPSPLEGAEARRRASLEKMKCRGKAKASQSCA